MCWFDRWSEINKPPKKLTETLWNFGEKLERKIGETKMSENDKKIQESQEMIRSLSEGKAKEK